MLKFREAMEADLPEIIALLADDELGGGRESLSQEDFAPYKRAFDDIVRDTGQFLVVGDDEGEVVATCQLSMIPCLAIQGKKRLQIEAVRVKSDRRGQKIGEKMFAAIFDFGRKMGCEMAQLTTNAQREAAQRFYERLGFEATHIGMKKKLL